MRTVELSRMDSEMSNFILVWSSFFMSASYCYTITKVVPKGTIRLLMFLPVVYLFLILPLNLNSVNLVSPTVFFVTWLTTFKLLLLVFGNGPLSNPSLSLLQFVFVACFPVVLPKATNSNSVSSPLTQEKIKHITRKGLLHMAKKGSTFIFLIGVGQLKDKISPGIFSLIICYFVYVVLDLMLGVVSFMGQVVLRTELEPGFMAPYRSTSLQDFWSRRWNRAASSALRSVVFEPIKRNLSRVVNDKWASDLALIGTFIFSALMHELIVYYSIRVRPDWGMTRFFIVHGLCMIVEKRLKNIIDQKWQAPQLITGPLIFGFAVCSFSWMALPQLVEHNADDRILAEYAAVGSFVKDLGLTLRNWALSTIFNQ